MKRRHFLASPLVIPAALAVPKRPPVTDLLFASGTGPHGKDVIAFLDGEACLTVPAFGFKPNGIAALEADAVEGWVSFPDYDAWRDFRKGPPVVRRYGRVQILFKTRFTREELV